MRYSINLSYCGATFHGWQVQPDAPSVQGALESALSVLLKEQVCLTGAGRTDTGVNAIGYTAHFDCSTAFDTGLIAYKLNAILPTSIVVHDIVPEAPDFHARFDANRREYTYFLHRVKDPFVESFSYRYTYPVLDFNKMNISAAELCGRHDFRCFEKAGADSRTSICTIHKALWESYEPTLCAKRRILADGTLSEDYWKFTVCADRFLRNMVRALVGTLLEVGRGKRTAESFSSLILEDGFSPVKSVMRSNAGESVPGHALFLTSVDYKK
ncbi:MAG TPA: tRNA pseudouridine(38-40) synthase TruA [Rikenellaceae bacterium]|nr:tRNA pseudouridine(38-40) synthase TruA [Rikenellaceae bacterium]HCZ22075.1 tRNA pseudouridine(38-40) synthase TruA [Rikenellaceae bacterium]